MKHPIRHRLEYALARCFIAVFAALPLALASNLGAALGAMVGRLPPLARRVERNLALAMPELGATERAAIRAGVWRNLGRTIAEIPHLHDFTLTDGPPGQGQVQVLGAPAPEQEIGTLYFGAHIGNWELMTLVAAKLGRPMHGVYRAPNNPLIDQWLRRQRARVSLAPLPKGASAARAILTALNRGGAVGMLVDQKMNDGIPVLFFGRRAMTAPALAQLALRRGIDLVPMRCERLNGAAFRISFLTPLSPGPSDDAAALMGRVNQMLEAWIRDRPEQWLWPHNRWPKEADDTQDDTVS